MSEVWKPVVGYKGSYEISDRGRVRSLDRIDALGNTRKGILRKLGSTPSGYRVISLCRNGKTRHASVHSEVLRAFVGPRPKGKWGAHGNGRRTDNRLSNLRWATPKANSADRALHGTLGFNGKHWTQKYPERLVGEANANSKLTPETVRAIRKARKRGVIYKTLAAKFGVCKHHIFKVCNRLIWAHV